MGQYAEAEIIVSFNEGAKAKQFAKIINNFHEELKKRRISKGLDIDFDTNIDSVDVDFTFVTIRLSSSRVQNTEWQCDEIFDIAKGEFKEFITEFDANVTTPYGYIYWNSQDDDEE